MRWAIQRSPSGLMIPSASATTYHEGCSRHAGGPDLNMKRAASAGPWTSGHDARLNGIDVLCEQPRKLILRKRKESVLVDNNVLCGFQRGKATDQIRGTLVTIGRERRHTYHRSHVRRVVSGLRDDDTTERMTNDHHRRVEFVGRPTSRCGVVDDRR